MPYHHTTPSTSTLTGQSTINAQGQVAPEGYHYMPDGSLMADSDMISYQTSSPEPGSTCDFDDVMAVGMQTSLDIPTSIDN